MPVVVVAAVVEATVVELSGDSVSNAIVGEGASVGDGANVGEGAAEDDAWSCFANNAASPRVETALNASDATFALRAGLTRRRIDALRRGGDGGGKLTPTVCRQIVIESWRDGESSVRHRLAAQQPLRCRFDLAFAEQHQLGRIAQGNEAVFACDTRNSSTETVIDQRRQHTLGHSTR